MMLAWGVAGGRGLNDVVMGVVAIQMMLPGPVGGQMMLAWESLGVGG